MSRKKIRYRSKVSDKKLPRSSFCHVTYVDTWSMDTRLAEIIAAHLRAFIKAENGPSGGVPGCIYSQYGNEKGSKTWMEILNKMLYAFEEYQRKFEINIERMNIEESQKLSDMEKQAALDKLAERKEKIKEGMQLFIDYYSCLWI